MELRRLDQQISDSHDQMLFLGTWVGEWSKVQGFLASGGHAIFQEVKIDCFKTESDITITSLGDLPTEPVPVRVNEEEENCQGDVS